MGAHGPARRRLLLPDIVPATSSKNDEWYLTEDWAELLRQAVRSQVLDVRYEVVPRCLNPVGEHELDTEAAAGPGRSETPTFGYLFSLRACAPPSASAAPDGGLTDDVGLALSPRCRSILDVMAAAGGPCRLPTLRPGRRNERDHPNGQGQQLRPSDPAHDTE